VTIKPALTDPSAQLPVLIDLEYRLVTMDGCAIHDFQPLTQAQADEVKASLIRLVDAHVDMLMLECSATTVADQIEQPSPVS